VLCPKLIDLPWNGTEWMNNFNNALLSRPGSSLMLLTLLVVLTACGSPSQHTRSVSRGDTQGAVTQLRALIEHEMRSQRLAGLSIALVEDQRVLWTQGFGWADPQNKQAAAPETVYRVGSISKLFTATAVMQMVEAGQVNLDAPVQAVLPQFQIRSRFGPASAIMPRQLLTHHAGLPRDIGHGMWTADPQRFTAITTALERQDAAYPPQTVFSYSNQGFDVLGHVVEQVAGQSFESHVQRNLLVPMGMTTASFTAALPNHALMAKPYNKGQVAPEPPLRDVPAGGLNASVLDLSRFLSMVFAKGRVADKAVLQPQTVAQMLSVQNADVALDLGFRNGLGWMLSTLGESNLQGAGVVAHHGGATVNFRSQLYALPEHKLGVVVLSNDAAAQQAVNRIAVKALALLLETQSGITQPLKVKPVESKQAWTDQAMQAIEGDYTTLLGHVRVIRKGSGLQAEAFGRTFKLQPLQGHQLGLRYSLLGLLPVSLGELDFVAISTHRVAGREVLVARSGGQDMLLGEKIKPLFNSPNPEQWVGRYEFLNRTADDPFQGEVTVESVRGFFLARIKDFETAGLPPAMPLLPISATEALVMGPLNGLGETARYSVVEGESRIEFSGYVLRRISN
jgi:CubicO group peptidase (beta-lactamase class C family)